MLDRGNQNAGSNAVHTSRCIEINVTISTRCINVSGSMLHKGNKRSRRYILVRVCRATSASIGIRNPHQEFAHVLHNLCNTNKKYDANFVFWNPKWDTRRSTRNPARDNERNRILAAERCFPAYNAIVIPVIRRYSRARYVEHVNENKRGSGI